MPQQLTHERPLGRSVEMDTGRRTVSVPVDSLGRMRYRANLVERSVAKRDDGSIGFKGHAAVFNQRTWIGGRSWGWWETIAPRAFAKTIGEADVRFLINHDPNLILGRNRANTLTLSEDEVGLHVLADMANVSYAQDIAVSLERGDVSQMSFAFEPLAYRWEGAEDGNDHFIITELRLADVSIVTYPAYETTDAGLRAAGFDVLCRSLAIDDDLARSVLEATRDDEVDSTLIEKLQAARQAPAVDEQTERSVTDQPTEFTGAHPSALRMLSQRTTDLDKGIH